MKKILDHGYLTLIESWGSDERIVEAARMSTNKGFKGWGERDCDDCNGGNEPGVNCNTCKGKGKVPGDERLLKYLYEHKHHTPFEMAGMIIEVQAPIMVFREWHRHRTQCLAPDTLIHFNAPRSKNNRRFVYKMRIEDIYKKWQPTVRKTRPERQENALFPRGRIQAMQLRCLNEASNEIGHTGIVDVILGEPKEMICVTTASGRSLTATGAHKVMTCDGWMPLGQAIASGALLTLEGTTRNKADRWEIPTVNQSVEEWRSIIGFDSYEVSNAGRVRRKGSDPKLPTIAATGYNVISMSEEGKTFVRTIHTLVLQAFHGPKILIDDEARHLNNNKADNRASNLLWGRAQENANDRIDSDRQQRLVPVYEEIVDVKHVGKLPTYDLTVRNPWHNFIADGFVVHNSYNEMSARYTPLPDVNYVPTPERCLVVNAQNKQAGKIAGAEELTHESVLQWLEELSGVYKHAEAVYQSGLKRGIPKELARLPVPVGRYSKMRASTCLRNWLGFLTLRMDSGAQWEIREFANAVGELIAEAFPRTWGLFKK